MSQTQPLSLEEALARAKLVHDRASLAAAIAAMGQRISNDYAGLRPVFMTVMNGGLIIAGHLALEIRVDCEFDSLQATRYRGGTEGGAVNWIKAPQVPLSGRDVLLVDDILDEGYTLAAVRDHCLAAGARSVRVAVLCVKRHGRTAPGIQADYFGVDVPDRYVFGFGMDYHGQGRNLPGIWAL